MSANSKAFADNFWSEEGYNRLAAFSRRNVKWMNGVQMILSDWANVLNESAQTHRRSGRRVLNTLANRPFFGRSSDILESLFEQINITQEAQIQLAMDLRAASQEMAVTHKSLKKSMKTLLAEVERCFHDQSVLMESLSRHRTRYMRAHQEAVGAADRLRAIHESDPKAYLRASTASSKAQKAEAVERGHYQAAVNKLAAYIPQMIPKVQLLYQELQDLNISVAESTRHAVHAVVVAHRPIPAISQGIIDALEPALGFRVEEDVDAWVEENKTDCSQPVCPVFEDQGPIEAEPGDRAIEAVPEESVSSGSATETISKVIAVWDYQATDPTELSFHADEAIKVLKEGADGWWLGVNTSGKTGLFPINYTRVPDS